MNLFPICPSCQRKLAPIAGATPGGATRVYDRTCRRCRETWRIVARPALTSAGLRVDRLDLAFVGHREVAGGE